MPSVPRVVCAGCLRPMEMQVSGINCDMRARWGSYFKIQGDGYTCPGCGARVITGWGNNPLGEHYQDGYAAIPTDVAVELDAPS